MFSSTLLVWAVEGRGNSKDPGADHVEAARVLVAAGSSVERTPPLGAPGPERTLEGLAELRQAAAERRRTELAYRQPRASCRAYPDRFELWYVKDLGGESRNNHSAAMWFNRADCPCTSPQRS